MQTTYFNYVPENDISKFKIKKKKKKTIIVMCEKILNRFFFF